MDSDNIKKEIRLYMNKKGFTYRSLANSIRKRHNIPITPQSLSNKLSRASLRYIDIKMIAEALGYRIKWEELP